MMQYAMWRNENAANLADFDACEAVNGENLPKVSRDKNELRIDPNRQQNAVKTG